MLSKQLLLFAIAAAIPLAFTPGRAAADWLVLGDGTRVETRGPWEVRGRLLVFTAADGRLSSLRVSEVDLDASRRATAATTRKRPEAPARPAARQPGQAVFVLTDADVSHRRSPVAAAPAPEAEPPAAPRPDGAEAPPQPEQLVVTQWQESTMPDDNGLRLNGTLQNRGGRAATRVRLTALAYDREGSLVATGEARLSTDVLMPTRQARFEVDLPGVFDFSDVRFNPTSLDFEAGAAVGGEPQSELGDAVSGPA